MSNRQDVARLEKRIVLLSVEGSGMIDSWVDIMSMTGTRKSGFVVETTMAGDPYDSPCNAFGEALGERCECPGDAEQLFEAIQTVTHSDIRWDEIDWSWDEVLSNLRERDPKLSADLSEVLKNRSGNPVETR